MQAQNLKSKVVKGAAWTLIEKLSTHAVNFVVSMVLARMLTPNDYGTVALTTIFFAFANVLVDGGFGNALIQKKDADELDFNSVFYLNIGLSILAYSIMFFAAPLIACFYETPELVPIMRVSAFCFLFHAVNAVQNAELTKKMLFHLSIRVSLITCFTSAVCGVTLACLGAGVWALVWSSLIAGAVGVGARWFIIAWRPRLMFSFARLKPLFSYGWKIAVSALIDQFFMSLNGLLIGKCYSKTDLAYVNKGNSIPSLAMNEVDGTLGRVSFPALVLMQNDKDKLREVMRRMIQCSTFLVFPLMVGIALCSHSLLRLLYGPQWVPAAPYMMLACISFAFWPFHTINLRGIMALGRSDIFLKLEIIKKVMKLAVILIAFRHGVFAFMAASAFALGPLSVIINAWPNSKLLGYTISMQVKDVLPTALICIAEAVVVFGVECAGNILFDDIVLTEYGTQLIGFITGKLVLQFAFGSVVFFGLAWMLRLKPFGEYLRLVSGAIERRFPCIATVINRRFVI